MKPTFTGKLFAAAVLLAATTTAAAAWPEQPIRLTVGFPAGTGPDIVARTVGEQLSKELGQPVVVENKAGAGGQIAAQSVANATPNGYTILLGEVGSISISPETTSELSYKPLRDFAPISEAVRADFVLVTPPDSPYADLKSFVKGDNNIFNFATFGAGTPGHFGAELLAEAGGFEIEPIHYRSTGDAVTAIISGQVQGAFITTAMANTQIPGGKMKGLAITGAERSKMLKDIPTFREEGMEQVNFGAWFAFFAPAGTPENALDTLHKGIVDALNNANVRTTLENAGFAIIGSSRQELADLLVSEQKVWSGVVQKTGFKIN
ncbi:Bug family tripartite tricarboxylate transporter substrate binding protein [Yanghanlia caeni]|uniref:Tripartite tricarboxylate transporter substrate binding protein n=1 Tax=Yanghanlia caeni TaxID=3064283 RepID=A0ABU1D8B2_9BURK|nr:tripartite tricarboxylate transporter substrate binding protein [Alcaligenaceae bacterium LG-2]